MKSSRELRHSYISPAEFGFYNKYKEINFSLMSENRIFGSEIDSIKMTLSLPSEKVQKVAKTCENLLRSHSTNLLESTRVVGLLSSTIQAVEPGKIQLNFFNNYKLCV